MSTPSSTAYFMTAARATLGTATTTGSSSDTAILTQYLESDLVELVHSRRLAPGLRASLHSSHLSSNMQSSSTSSSPAMGSRFSLTTLSQQPLILQVNDVSDVSMALAGRVGAVKGGTRGDAAAGPMGGSRLLKLLLTDGHDIITAIEIRSCAPLSQVKIGSKIAIAPGCVVRWLGASNGGGGPEPTHCTLLLTPEVVLGVGGIVKDLALQHHKLQRQVASSLEGRAPQKQRQDHQDGSGAGGAILGGGGPSSGRAEEEIVHAVASTVRYAPTKTTLLSANRQQNSNSNPPIQQQQQQPAIQPPPPQPVHHNQPHPQVPPPPQNHHQEQPQLSVVVAEDVDDWDEDVPLIVAAATRAVSSSQAPSTSNRGGGVHTTPTPRPPSQQPQDAYSVALRCIAGGGGGGAMERVVAEVVLSVVQYCCIREIVSGILTRTVDVSNFEGMFTGADGNVGDSLRFMMVVVVDGGGGNGSGGQVVDLGHDFIYSEVLKGRWSPQEFNELSRDASRVVEYGDVMKEAIGSLFTLPPLYMTLLPVTHPTPYDGTARPLALAIQASTTPPAVWEEAADVVLVVDDEDL